VRNLIKKILREETSVNFKEDKLKYLVFKLINRAVEGVDLYEDKGSLWLIFTDNKEWVIKLNKKGVLWYNYYFFNSIFKYLSLNVVENQHYITEWVEDTIKNGVKFTSGYGFDLRYGVENTIKNGVKFTLFTNKMDTFTVEDTIKNGENLGKIKND
jgi:hypothetical protein